MTRGEELAWAAGFFDGEGCTTVSFTPDKTRRVIRITIGQKDVRVLLRFHKAIGFGRVLPMKRKLNPGHMWCVWTFEHVQQTICILWPWLDVVKREQAKLALTRFRSEWKGGLGYASGWRSPRTK